MRTEGYEEDCSVRFERTIVKAKYGATRYEGNAIEKDSMDVDGKCAPWAWGFIMSECDASEVTKGPRYSNQPKEKFQEEVRANIRFIQK